MICLSYFPKYICYLIFFLLFEHPFSLATLAYFSISPLYIQVTVKSLVLYGDCIKERKKKCDYLPFSFIQTFLWFSVLFENYFYILDIKNA